MRKSTWRQDTPRDELVAILSGIRGHLLNISEGTVTGEKAQASARKADALAQDLFDLGDGYLPKTWEA